VPERKVRSGTILEFGLKKENNFITLNTSGETVKGIFRGFRSDVIYLVPK
jgi:hypothetical protein